MKLITCALLLTLAGGWQLAAGADATATTAAPDTVATDNTPSAPPALELKHKSSFALEENSRNPFWPIGWKPAPKANGQASDAAGPEVSPDAFLVSSITMDVGARFAIINGKAMSEGQVFGLQLGNQTYQITVKSIEDGRVILLRRDQEIEVALRRR
jgi:hypothetical protein